MKLVFSRDAIVQVVDVLLNLCESSRDLGIHGGKLIIKSIIT